jgi:hypothetical protein
VANSIAPPKEGKKTTARDSKAIMVAFLGPALAAAEVSAAFRLQKTLRKCTVFVEKLIRAETLQKGSRIERDLIRNLKNFQDVVECSLKDAVGGCAKKNLRHWNNIKEAHKYNMKGKVGKKFRQQQKGRNKKLKKDMDKKHGRVVKVRKNSVAYSCLCLTNDSYGHL